MQKIVPAFEFRRRARAAMKPVMSVLLVVALIATLPSLLGSVVNMITGAESSTLLTSFSDRSMQLMEKYGLVHSGQVVEDVVVDEAALEADTLALLEGMMEDTDAFLKEKGPIMAATALAALVFSPVLTLGLINALLHALRKQEFTFSIALSRLSCFFRVIGLQLLVTLKTILWMIPGLAVMVVSLYVPAEWFVTLLIVGLAGSMIAGIMATYRYAMSPYVMADAPETSILGCFRRSKETMHRRKGELFFLELSFIGWSLLLSYVQSMLYSFGAVIGLTLGMFASLFLTVYTNCAKAAFYQEYGVGPLPEESATQEPETEELT